GGGREWQARVGWSRPSVLDHKPARVTAVAFSSDGKVLASACSRYDRRLRQTTAREVRFWAAETGRLLRSVPGPVGGIGALAFSPDGALLAAAMWPIVLKGETRPGEIKLLDATTGKEVRSVAGLTTARSHGRR